MVIIKIVVMINLSTIFICFSSASKINYAYRKKATQSSVAYNGVAGNAVDGNRDPDYDGNSCTHTSNDYEAWWMVDLGQSVPVYKVFIVNRINHGERLHDFQILIGK